VANGLTHAIVADRDEIGADEVVSQAYAAGGTARFVPTDASRAEDLRPRWTRPSTRGVASMCWSPRLG
jgi:hypothetical protein